MNSDSSATSSSLTGAIKKSHLSLVQREFCNNHHNFLDPVLKYLIVAKVSRVGFGLLGFSFNPCCTHRNRISLSLSDASYSRIPPTSLLLLMSIYTGALPSQGASISFTLLVYQKRLGRMLSELQRPKPRVPDSPWSCSPQPAAFQGGSQHHCAGQHRQEIKHG